jgi:TonB family protein
MLVGFSVGRSRRPRSAVIALFWLLLGTGLSSAQTIWAGPFPIPRCPGGLAPQSLFTPAPMLEVRSLRVFVDFIVNKQGRVEAPLVLESSGETNEKLVLSTLQQWRFRPAICNGVPTPVELRVLFVGPRTRLPHPVGFRRRTFSYQGIGPGEKLPRGLALPRAVM